MFIPSLSSALGTKIWRQGHHKSANVAVETAFAQQESITPPLVGPPHRQSFSFEFPRRAVIENNAGSPAAMCDHGAWCYRDVCVFSVTWRSPGKEQVQHTRMFLLLDECRKQYLEIDLDRYSELFSTLGYKGNPASFDTWPFRLMNYHAVKQGSKTILLCFEDGVEDFGCAVTKPLPWKK